MTEATPLAAFAPVAPSAFRRSQSGRFECDAALGRLVVVYLRGPLYQSQTGQAQDREDDRRVGALPQAVEEWIQWDSGGPPALSAPPAPRNALQPLWYTYDVPTLQVTSAAEAAEAPSSGIHGWIVRQALLIFKDGVMVELKQLRPNPYPPGSARERLVEVTTLHALVRAVLRHVWEGGEAGNGP